MNFELSKIIGIDYGAKLAGTTVISFFDGKKIKQAQSDKGQDADAFVSSFVNEKNIELVFIDAPLSLPPAYSNSKNSEFFYRECDRITNAMSPMFLGGLTARAMKLRREFQRVEFYETYPSHLIKSQVYLNWESDKMDLVQSINKLFKPYKLAEGFSNKHQMDSAYALLSAYRYVQGNHLKIGNEREGIIII